MQKCGVHDIGNKEDTYLRVTSFLTFVEEHKTQICGKILEELPGRVTIGIGWESRIAYPFIMIEVDEHKKIDIITWRLKLLQGKL